FRRPNRNVLSSVFSLFIFCATAFGQVTSGSVTGSVLHQTSAAVVTAGPDVRHSERRGVFWFLSISGSFKLLRHFRLLLSAWCCRLVLITFAALRLSLQPGAVSLLYLIAVVFVSLRAGLVSSIAVSLVAVFLLQHYFVPLFSPQASKNPLAIVASLAFLVTAWVISAM